MNAASTGFPLLLALASALVASATARGQVVADSHFKYEKISYFRAGASNVKLGSYGEKKHPVTKTHYLSVDGTIPASKLTNVQAVEVNIDFSKTSSKDFFGSIDTKALYGGSVDVAWEKAKRAELRLVKLFIPSNALAAAANKSPKVLDSLRERGKDARLVNVIFVVVEAEIAKKLTSSASIELSAEKGPATAKVKGGSNGSKEVSCTLDPGSTFAYGLMKLDWEKGKDKIDCLDPDQFGM
jgi:hypothetical protein